MAIAFEPFIGVRMAIGGPTHHSMWAHARDTRSRPHVTALERKVKGLLLANSSPIKDTCDLLVLRLASFEVVALGSE